MSLDNVEVNLDTYEVAFDKPNAEFYAQVIFLNVAESYPTDAHVECRYEIRPTLTASGRDWIGLFRVGWSNVREYFYFHWVKLPADYQGGRQVSGDVLFMCQNLPKDDGEYYQFCFVTAEGLVRGASTPFQFRRPGSDDLVTFEDDESDILLVTTRTVVLEEQLSKTLATVEDLENEKIDVMCEKKQIETRLKDLHMKLEFEQEKNGALEKENQVCISQISAAKLTRLKELHMKLEFEQERNGALKKKEWKDKMAAIENEMKDLMQAQENTQEKVLFITKEKEEILKRLEENEVYIKALQDKIKALLAEKDTLTGKQKMLEEERELYKNHFTTSESTIHGYLREIADLKKALQDESVRRSELEQTLPLMEAELEREKKATNTQKAYTKSLSEKIHVLQEKLKNCEDKLMAVEHCKMMLNEEVIAVHDAHDKMAASLEKALGESHSLKSQICQLEEDNEKNADTLREEIATLQKQNANLVKVEQDLRHKLKAYEERPTPRRFSRDSSVSSVSHEEEEGAHYALKLAQVHLEKTLAKYKRKYDELKSQIDETKKVQRNQQTTEKDLRDEIQDLKERLAMGAEEYKMKFIECKRLQKELRRLKKQAGEDMTPCSPVRDVSRVQKSGSPSKGRRESCTQVDEELTKGEEAAWQQHLDTYQRILDTRYSNLCRQKRDEEVAMTERNEELEHYRHLAQTREDMLSRLQLEKQVECQTLRDIIVKQKSEIRRLEDKQRSVFRRDVQTGFAQASADRNPWDQSVIYPTIDLRSVRRQTPSAPAWPPSQWLEKVETEKEHDWPKCVGKRSSDSGKARPEKKLKELAKVVKNKEKSEDTEFVLAREAFSNGEKGPLRLVEARKVTAEASVLEAEQTKDKPARPLPPPIKPIVLPSAKLAAIRAKTTDPAAESGMANIFDRLDQLEISEREGEHEEERFQDAAGEPQKICPVCTTAFPADISQSQFEQHVETHYGPVCPVCYKQFPEDCELKMYEEHVYTHFDDRVV